MENKSGSNNQSIYIIDDIEKYTRFNIDDALDLLSDQRINKINSLIFEKDKIESALSYLLLKFALFKEYQIESIVEFILGANGKPYLRDYPNIFFSISHCNEGICCVLSKDCEIGVDIEGVHPYDLNLAKYYCTTQELCIIESARNRKRQDFLSTCIWTIKEAYYKMKGTGIQDDINKFSIFDICDSDISVYYNDELQLIISVCRKLEF